MTDVAAPVTATDAERGPPPTIGVVAIGRNEGQRLAECLRSVLVATDRVVYADSGSSDGSPELAEGLGARVVRLHEGPFTAARGRQAGTETLVERWPDTEFVLYIDGDCVLQPGFVETAARELRRDPSLGAVCARRRESRTAESFWSRVSDIEWAEPPGPVPYFGGDGLCRVAAVQSVGGWSTDLIAGEEPDLCFRMKDVSGYGVLRLPVDMSVHDVAMTSFGQYFRRSIRSGHAFAEVGLRHREGSGRSWWRAAISIVAYGLILPLIAIGGAFVHWAIPVLVGLLYARVLFSMVRFASGRGFGAGLSFAYAVLNLACKFGGLIGVVTYAWGRVRGKKTVLIEYHRPPVSLGDHR